MVTKVIGFPGRYIQGPGALAEIGTVFEALGFRRPLALADSLVKDIVWASVEPLLRAAGATPTFVDFSGECTQSVIDGLTETGRTASIDSVVAFGGGKTIDAAKGLARALDLPITICPTVASSDAPTSRLIVRYDDNHRLADVDFTRRNPDAVIVDTQIIASAPVRLFAAGIGDALSKHFEARQCQATEGTNSFGTAALDTALLLTDTVYERLLTSGPQAYAAVREQRWNEALEHVVEATVLASGVGFESGGLSLAHALIRGLTAIPAMAGMMHGELVAFGTLVQVVVEDRSAKEIEPILKLMAAVELPMTLADLGQTRAFTAAERDIIIEATLATNYSRHMTPPLTGETLMAGIQTADARGQQWQSGR